jgi:hypothetical protein
MFLAREYFQFAQRVLSDLVLRQHTPNRVGYYIFRLSLEQVLYSSDLLPLG